MSQHQIASVENNAEHIRAWDGPSATIYYFLVITTDGLSAQVGKTSTDPPKVGDRYNTLQAPSPNAPADALPTLKDREGAGGGGSGGGGGKSYEADPKGLRGKNASMAVAYAKDLVVGDKIELSQISLYAEKFYGFIESKAQVGE